MPNYFLTLIVLVGLVGTFANAPAPEPVSRPVPSRPASSSLAAASPVIAPAPVLEAQRPPIPLVRQAVALPTATASRDVPAAEADGQAQADLDMKAAKAAIEADGYKGVRVLGKASNGGWRAKAYRGATEVQVTVDGAGGVSAD